ncbi:hypothetical protein IL306_004638 [Fusarium sp. DS 682]|nr:hypothetical protein IL306_004638 [Fusarium sp. DS 682]
MSTSQPNKRGRIKVHLVTIDLFTGKKVEDISLSTQQANIPEVTRRKFQVVDISSDDVLTLKNDEGETKDHVHMPTTDLGDEIRDRFNNNEETRKLKYPALRKSK